MELCERLRELRKEHKYSQEDAADKLGVSRQAISKWESGQGKPEINNIIKLAEIYDVTTDYLLAGKENTSCENYPAIENNDIYKKMIAVIAILGAAALITVLFIAMLFFLEKFVFSV